MRNWRVAGIYILAGVSFCIVSSNASAQQRTAKACEAEWRANKPAIQASGTKKRDFIVQCRAGTANIPTPNKAASDKAANPAETQGSAAATPSRRPDRRATNQTLKAGEYSTEAEAKAQCPQDTVVWANKRSRIYHYAGSRNYGSTKSGAYMCEHDTAVAGIRAAKNQKRR